MAHLAEINAGPLPNEHQSVFWHIEQGLIKSPHKPAVVCMHQPATHLSDLLPADARCRSQNDCLTLSYTQLHRAALDLAGGILAHGVQPGARILTLIPNGGEYGVLLWACTLMRLTITSMDPSALDEGVDKTELTELIRELKPDIVVLGSKASTRTLDLVAKIAGLGESLLRICFDDDLLPEGWKSLRSLWTHGSSSSSSSAEEEQLLEDARNDDPNRLHSILFTSGTSAGLPKGCPQRVEAMTYVLEHLAWLITPDNASRVLQQAHNSRAIAPAHTLQTWRQGGTVVMADASFALPDTLHAIFHHRVTFLVLSPAMVHGLAADLVGKKTDSVQTIHLGGAAVTRDVLAKCASLFPRASVCISHGMTEGLGFFEWPFMHTPSAEIPFFGEICPTGAVARGTRLRIRDLDGETVSARGKLGELHVWNDSVIRRYLADGGGGGGGSSFYQDEQGPWFISGDIAMMDASGLVYILGRGKDTIRRPGGVVIMPSALESCIERYCGRQTAVVSIPLASGGYEPFAVVSDFNGMNEAAIGTHVLRTLGEDYALAGVVSLEQIGLHHFPVNATAKVINFEVQKKVLEYLNHSSALG